MSDQQQRDISPTATPHQLNEAELLADEIRKKWNLQRLQDLVGDDLSPQSFSRDILRGLFRIAQAGIEPDTARDALVDEIYARQRDASARSKQTAILRRRDVLAAIKKLMDEENGGPPDEATTPNPTRSRATTPPPPAAAAAAGNRDPSNETTPSSSIIVAPNRTSTRSLCGSLNGTTGTTGTTLASSQDGSRPSRVIKITKRNSGTSPNDTERPLWRSAKKVRRSSSVARYGPDGGASGASLPSPTGFPLSLSLHDAELHRTSLGAQERRLRVSLEATGILLQHLERTVARLDGDIEQAERDEETRVESAQQRISKIDQHVAALMRDLQGGSTVLFPGITVMVNGDERAIEANGPLDEGSSVFIAYVDYRNKQITDLESQSGSLVNELKEIRHETARELEVHRDELRGTEEQLEHVTERKGKILELLSAWNSLNEKQ